MRTVTMELVLALALAAVSGCPAEGAMQNGLDEDADRDGGADEERPDDDDDDDDGRSDAGTTDDEGPDDANDDDERVDAGAGGDAGVPIRADAGSDDALADAGMDPEPAPDEPDPTLTPRTDVPDELVGVWQAGSIDFVLWENYTEGYYASRDAFPSREAMILEADGDAKFYRYEFAYNFYEELIDCEGTVAFHGDGTFTFYPTAGRKRFYDTRYSPNNVDRALTADELVDPKLAGSRAYDYVADSTPPALRITIPSSAPYNWYKVE